MHTIGDINFKEKFLSVYLALQALHPEKSEGFQYQYVSKEWFFSNHIDIVLENILKFATR